MKGIILILLLCFTLACTTTKIVEVPVETTKTEYLHTIQYDSIYIRDSIDRYTKGDTVFIFKQNTQYKYKTKIDTIIQRDSIPVPITVETIKEVNVLTWYQKVLMYLGVGLLLYLIILILKKI